MNITTEEAELLAQTHDLVRFTLGMKAPEHDLTATALRSLAAERDALRAEVESLLGPPIDKAERKKNLVAAGVSEKTADEMLKSPVYDRHLGRASVDPLQAENARLREGIEMARECIDDKDVIGARLTLTKTLEETT